MEEQIEIGNIVEIPFGKGNRLTKGYVVELTETEGLAFSGIWVDEASFGDYAMPRLLERMLEKIRLMFGADVKKV